jgi:hypothetical protein
MKDLDLATLVAVFQEMLGWSFWAIVAASALATLAFVAVLLRDRGIVPARLVRAEALGVLGGAAAVLAMFAVTNSSVSDLGGPIDWLLVLGIFLVGLFGTAVGAYALMGLLAPARAPRAAAEVRRAAA